MRIMRGLMDTLPNKTLRILDVGSAVIRGQKKYGCYRDLMKSYWYYTGADIVPGRNVDVVLETPWQFGSEFDVVLSGQCIEHVARPWEWFQEVARVLKPGGTAFIIAPSVIHQHRYPIDTFRYYPDGMYALAEYAGLRPLKSELVRDGKIEDCYLVAQK